MGLRQRRTCRPHRQGHTLHRLAQKRWGLAREFALIHIFNISGGLTGEGVSTSWLGGTDHMPFSVLDDEIGYLVEEHGTEIVFLQEVVRCQPGVIRHVVGKLHRRPALIHVDGEHVIILLRGDMVDGIMDDHTQAWHRKKKNSSSSHLSFVYYTLGRLLV